jgi:hypothetical protein
MAKHPRFKVLNATQVKIPAPAKRAPPPGAGRGLSQAQAFWLRNLDGAEWSLTEYSMAISSVTGYADMGNVTTLDASETASMSVTFNPTALTSGGLITRLGASGAYQFAVSLSNPGRIIVKIAATTTDITGIWQTATGFFEAGKDMNITVVYDGSLTAWARLVL